MQIIRFKVDGEPCGKGRPRFSTRRGTRAGKPVNYVSVHTPAKTRSYEDYVVTCYMKEYHGLMTKEVPLEIEIKAFFGIPQSFNKSNRFKAIVGSLLPTKKPDVDNVAKIVLDALNKVAYPDDKWITDLTVHKRYAENPRVEIMIKEALQ